MERLSPHERFGLGLRSRLQVGFSHLVMGWVNLASHFSQSFGFCLCPHSPRLPLRWDQKLSYFTNLTILESLFDLSCFSLSIFSFQNVWSILQW